MVNIFQRYILWYFLPKAKRALFKPFHLCAENALSFSFSLSLSLSQDAHQVQELRWHGYFDNRNTVRGKIIDYFH